MEQNCNKCEHANMPKEWCGRNCSFNNSNYKQLLNILIEKEKSIKKEVLHHHDEGRYVITAIKEGEQLGLKWSINEVKKLLNESQNVNNDEYSICEKCGAKYMQRLFKPMTICEKCYDNLL
jgi:RNA polymerase-binding transcription factor DksA